MINMTVSIPPFRIQPGKLQARITGSGTSDLLDGFCHDIFNEK